jgi:hypothetical protein
LKRKEREMRLKRGIYGLLFALVGLFATVAPDAVAMVGVPAVPMGVAGAEVMAVVGRPLTPVSYAGVARRTVRRSYY